MATDPIPTVRNIPVCVGGGGRGWLEHLTGPAAAHSCRGRCVDRGTICYADCPVTYASHYHQVARGRCPALTSQTSRLQVTCDTEFRKSHQSLILNNRSTAFYLVGTLCLVDRLYQCQREGDTNHNGAASSEGLTFISSSSPHSLQQEANRSSPPHRTS
jgi:hypothetical protein